MKKIFVFALVPVLLIGCGKNGEIKKEESISVQNDINIEKTETTETGSESSSDSISVYDLPESFAEYVNLCADSGINCTNTTENTMTSVQPQNDGSISTSNGELKFKATINYNNEGIRFLYLTFFFSDNYIPVRQVTFLSGNKELSASDYQIADENGVIYVDLYRDNWADSQKKFFTDLSQILDSEDNFSVKLASDSETVDVPFTETDKKLLKDFCTMFNVLLDSYS